MTSPIFLRSVPDMKPRTLCACQPVAFMMTSHVAPSRSRARTVSAFVTRADAGTLGAGVAPFACVLALGAAFFAPGFEAPAAFLVLAMLMSPCRLHRLIDMNALFWIEVH